MLLEIQKIIVTLSQVQSSEGITLRKITSGSMAMKVQFQGKILPDSFLEDSKKARYYLMTSKQKQCALTLGERLSH